MTQPDKSYRDLSREERLAICYEALKPSERDAVMELVTAHFEGRPIPDDPAELLNVVLREAWRHEYGEVDSWDRVARRAGVFIQ